MSYWGWCRFVFQVMLLTLGGCCVGLGSNAAVNADGFAAGYFGSLACEKPALFSPMFYSPAFIFSSGYSLGFGFLAGLRLLVLRQFSAFLPAVRRLRGAALFHGPRPSSSQGAPFWPSGLTVRRSRPPTAAAELRALAQI